MWYKNCRKWLSELTYPPCGFNEYDNNTNGDNSNGSIDNKHKNINNGDISFSNR